jgi:hypothetical protein
MKKPSLEYGLSFHPTEDNFFPAIAKSQIKKPGLKFLPGFFYL